MQFTSPKTLLLYLNSCNTRLQNLLHLAVAVNPIMAAEFPLVDAVKDKHSPAIHHHPVIDALPDILWLHTAHLSLLVL